MTMGLLAALSGLGKLSSHARIVWDVFGVLVVPTVKHSLQHMQLVPVVRGPSPYENATVLNLPQR